MSTNVAVRGVRNATGETDGADMWTRYLVPVAAGVSVLLGYRARVGAWLLVLFLVPVTIMMHNFWAIPPLDDRRADERLPCRARGT